MQVFKASVSKAAVRILVRNPVYFFVYVIALSFMGVAMAASFSVDNVETFERPHVDYAVIDRDNSAVSRGIESLLSQNGTRVDVDDSELAIQDAVAKGAVDYLLIVPSGFGEEFVDDARAGVKASSNVVPASVEDVQSFMEAFPESVEDVAAFSDVASDAAGATDASDASDADQFPKMEVVYSFYASEGALIDSAVASYLGLLQSCAVLDPNASDNSLAEDALELSDKTVQVDVITDSDSMVEADTYAFYLQFGAYGLFASIIACAGMLITTLNRADVRRRNLASPISYISYNMQIAFACIALALVVWAWFYVLGMICFPESIAATSAVGIALEGCVLFVFALVPLGVAFLVGQLGLGMGATNAIGNIAGLVVSFFGGAWIPLDLAPEGVAVVAHFLPGYWFTSSVSAAAHMTTPTFEAIAPVFAGMGMLLLFAIVFFLIGLVVAKMKTQTSEAGGNALVPTIAI